MFAGIGNLSVLQMIEDQTNGGYISPPTVLFPSTGHQADFWQQVFIEVSSSRGYVLAIEGKVLKSRHMKK